MERPTTRDAVTREQFERVRPLFEGVRRRTRPRKHDLYDVFNAVLYFLNSGIAWRALPARFPPWRTVHEYFTQWSAASPHQSSVLATALRELELEQASERLRVLMQR